MPPDPPTDRPVTRAMRAFVMAGRWLPPNTTSEMAFTAGVDAGIQLARRDAVFADEWQAMMTAAAVGQPAGTLAHRAAIVDEMLNA